MPTYKFCCCLSVLSTYIQFVRFYICCWVNKERKKERKYKLAEKIACLVAMVSGDDDDSGLWLFVDHVIVFFKGRSNNEVITHDWSHLNDTRLQIFGR